MLYFQMYHFYFGIGYHWKALKPLNRYCNTHKFVRSRQDVPFVVLGHYVNFIGKHFPLIFHYFTFCTLGNVQISVPVSNINFPARVLAVSRALFF